MWLAGTVMSKAGPIGYFTKPAILTLDGTATCKISFYKVFYDEDSNSVVG